jgi:hypothetical protein
MTTGPPGTVAFGAVGGKVTGRAGIGDAVAGGAANGNAATGGAAVGDAAAGNGVRGGIVMATGATWTGWAIGIAGRGPAVQDKPAAMTTTRRARTGAERMLPRSLEDSRQARAAPATFAS